MSKKLHSKYRLVLAVLTAGLLLAACGGDGDDAGEATEAEEEATETTETTEAEEAEESEESEEAEEAEAPAEEVELTLAHSFTDDHPHNRCGAQLVADKVADADVGLTVNVFSNSQLGGDADRFASVISGDIDIDLQGSSALSASYAPIGLFDRTFVFDGPDHLFDFFDSEGSQPLLEDFREATGAVALDVWYTGMRHFTANQPIRTPADLDGLRMRFPDSPIYLQNAEALGASATAVAYEEVFISLQQGVIDGQENPISNIASINLPEVQSHLSLSGHGTGSVLVVVSGDSWDALSAEQQDALATAVSETRASNRQCIEDDDQVFLDEWAETGAMEIVDDVDRDAFQQSTEAWYDANLEGADRELYEAIRASA